jgi:hypothetical protein
MPTQARSTHPIETIACLPSFGVETFGQNRNEPGGQAAGHAGIVNAKLQPRGRRNK